MKTSHLPFSSTLANLHVTTKLMVAFGTMLALTILISFEGIHSAAILNASTRALFDQDLVGISAIKPRRRIFQIKSTRVLRDVVISVGDKDAVEDQKQVLTELQSSVDEWLDAAQKALTDQPSRAKLAEIKAQIPAFRSLSRSVIERAAAGDQKAATHALKETTALSNHINLTIAEISVCASSMRDNPEPSAKRSIARAGAQC